MKINLENVKKAKSELIKLIPPTPLVKNEWLSSKYGCNVFLKLENMQPVGSFKLRGAFNKVMHLTQEERELGVLAVSAGNHAQGVAWAAKKFDVKATIIMPATSPIVKVMNTESLGAEVILHGESIDECFKFADDYMKKNPRVFIHPFHDAHIIEGQASCGLELIDQIDKVDFLFAGIGGGGLMAGTGFVLKDHNERTKIVGAQATGANSMVKSLQQGRLEPGHNVMTFADGIKVKVPIKEMYELLDSIVDEAVHIPDDAIATAVLDLMERACIITEGAGAISLAAFNEIFEKNPRRFRDKNIVLIISGGNIDINLVDRIIDKGLIESKRRINVSILLNDKPGSLRDLTDNICKTGANILQVVHDRNAPHLELQQSIVLATLETKGPRHSDEVVEAIRKTNIVIEVK